MPNEEEHFFPEEKILSVKIGVCSVERMILNKNMFMHRGRMYT
jgi:hypothetical protein